MKKLLSAVLLGSVIAFPSFAEVKPAKPAAPAAALATSSMRIGVLDIRTLMDTAPEVKDMQKKLQAEFKPKLDELQALDKGFREKFEKFQRDKDVLGEKERKKLEKELESTQQELIKLQSQYSKDTSEKQQKLMQVFLDKVKSKVEVFAKKEKYDLILIADAVPYMSDKVDITSFILKAIETKT